MLKSGIPDGKLIIMLDSDRKEDSTAKLELPDLAQKKKIFSESSILIKGILLSTRGVPGRGSPFPPSMPLNEYQMKTIINLLPHIIAGLKLPTLIIEASNLLREIIQVRDGAKNAEYNTALSDLCCIECAKISPEILSPNFNHIDIEDGVGILRLYAVIFNLIILDKQIEISQQFPNILDFISRLFEIIEEDYNTFPVLCAAVKMVLIAGDYDNSFKWMEDLLIMKFGNGNTIELLIRMIGDDSLNRIIQRRLLGVIERGIEQRFRINGIRFITEWGNTYGTTKKDLSDAFRSHLINMIKLENKHIGSVKFLFDEYGIVNFGRYYLNQLIKQYDLREKYEDGHGIQIYTRSDPNGSFMKSSLYDTLNNVLGINMKIYECDGTKELRSLLERNSIKHGKIGIAVLGGHGTEDSISLGHSNQDATLYTSDIIEGIEGKEVLTTFGEVISKMFQPGSLVILESCSTARGKRGGIARALSFLGLKVIGPTLSCRVHDIHLVKIKGYIRVYPTYVDPNRTIIPYKVFRGGIDITDEDINDL